ncbi:hypothetical protein MLD38_039690 [Melastoma candidum]|uniref:Uncharacterized protein n=1 Tax=Melastoma candidum TaxID=119954 RepID=A0ACB9L488_9MYRT|nr:hypothetical protein MLD38_039690 [Melastoma candidum]
MNWQLAKPRNSANKYERLRLVRLYVPVDIVIKVLGKDQGHVLTEGTDSDAQIKVKVVSAILAWFLVMLSVAEIVAADLDALYCGSLEGGGGREGETGSWGETRRGWVGVGVGVGLVG